SGVTQFATGDRVIVVPMTGCDLCPACQRGQVNYCRKMKLYGEHQDGTHCEYICIPQQSVMKLSNNITFTDAAAFPLVFVTAWHMLVTNGRVKQGDKVLVMGAASGVGSAAVQIAKLFGAEVIATAGSREKLAQAKQLGADHVINHYKEDIATTVRAMTSKRGVDLVIEHVGEKVWQDCLRSLGIGGRLITCGATTGPVVSMDLRHVFIKQQRIIGSTMGTLAELIEVHKHIAEGRLRPVVSRVFPYTAIKDAHRWLEGSGHFGKVVLDWGGAALSP
ncbi:MAG: zinc-binding dehydrogenase, partial [Deltaproteobacteria bacterium]|nr:zinc-binding dehydrogenase [Deltaproteobacteria bacterium]